MATIKDKIEIFVSQVDSFEEQQPELPAAEDNTIVVEGAGVYQPTNPEDSIEMLLATHVTSRFAEIQIIR